jgi:hypothetical protein
VVSTPAPTTPTGYERSASGLRPPNVGRTRGPAAPGRSDPSRHPLVAARWLLRFLEENSEATIEKAVLAASSLAALVGNGYLKAAQALRDMTEERSGDEAHAA